MENVSCGEEALEQQTTLTHRHTAYTHLTKNKEYRVYIYTRTLCCWDSVACEQKTGGRHGNDMNPPLPTQIPTVKTLYAFRPAPYAKPSRESGTTFLPWPHPWLISSLKHCFEYIPTEVTRNDINSLIIV